VIDSLFLELGIDTSKFSVDQQKSLKKISEFESQATRAANKARDSIKTVGQAFRDLSKESAIGSSVAQVESLAKKWKSLGQSMQVAGGVGTPFGMMAEGLGRLLSPAASGVAAVALLGKGMWDLNKNMTATNATMYRQAQLSGMNAANLWDWGEAARTVGANPQEVTGGIASLQTSIMGMGIGAANATPQLIALARLGVPFNFKEGADIPKLVAKVHAMAAAGGYQNLGALRALTEPVMSDALFNIATNPSYDPSQLKKEIKGKEATDTGEILRRSLESQTVLGKYGIAKDVLSETAYGGEQGLLQSIVEILTKLLDVVGNILDFITGKTVTNAVKSTWDAAKPALEVLSGTADADTMSGLLKGFFRPSAMRGGMSKGMQMLMSAGMSEADAAAMVGNMAEESSMNPLASNAGHAGLMQWDRARQSDFARRFGYSMGSSAVATDKQFQDQVMFAQDELQTTQQAAAAKMAQARGLLAKTSAFMNLDERPGDNSLSGRYGFAQQAMRLADVAGMKTSNVHHSVTSETHIGEINLYTPSDDPKAHVDVFRKGLADQPLLSPAAQGTVQLATRGSQ